MSGATVGRWATRPGKAASVRRLTRREEALAYLEQDRVYAAYAIGQLVDLSPGKCEAMAAESSAPALCIHLKGAELPFLLALGSDQGVADIFGGGLCPWQAYLVYKPDHAATVESFYSLHRKVAMLRMHVTEETFVPVYGDAVRLTRGHASELNRLYLTEMNCYVNGRQIEQGKYYGVWRDGRLAAVAGTHVISQSQGIAAVGNVFTHPEHRRSGCAAICTSVVTQELLRTCRDVVLSVKDNNTTARQVYERLGYRAHCRFFEAYGTWRLRTLLGRLTGRRFA